ncbi:hypothetical protein ASG50_01735 [Rhizobium sp. Leaf386]|nr:hypothetical protein ASG50_01735 [Rhizobium sp. Leaf386]
MIGSGGDHNPTSESNYSFRLERIRTIDRLAVGYDPYENLQLFTVSMSAVLPMSLFRFLRAHHHF